jgi:RNA polymerase sigma-70 factor, ECF subfamily
MESTEHLQDENIVARVLAGDTGAYEIIMRRHNQRLYRVVRAITRDDSETEDVIQDAYVRAYTCLHQFAGQAKFSTWLTKIAINEALARRRRSSHMSNSTDESGEKKGMERFRSQAPDPERQTLQGELRNVLESAIDALPEIYRIVFMMREVQDLSTTETADCLSITEETVKIRLHRSRAMLRRDLYKRAGAESSLAFQFLGDRCDRIVAGVMRRIQGAAVTI